MIAVLLNACSLFVMIGLGYLLKQIGLLNKSDGSRLSRIILNITLPAAIVVNLSSFHLQLNALILIAIAVGANFIQILVAFRFGKNLPDAKRQFMMYCGSGYNIGNFGLPFAQSFLPLGIPLISLFDMGNSIMLAGGTTVLIEFLLGKRTSFEPQKIILNLLKSPPFTCYLVMLILGLTNLTLPNALIEMIQPIANGNTFLSMFMIGLFLELRLPKDAKKAVCRILGLRYGIAFVLFLIFYFLPIEPMTKSILCLLAFTPIPLFGVINSVLAGMEESAVGFVSSVSFLISLPIMTGILILFGLS